MANRMISKKFAHGKSYTVSHKLNHPPVGGHWHDFYEFEIVLSGRAVTRCNGRRHLVQRGFMCLLSPMDLHEFTECRQLELLNIQFSGDAVDPALLKQLSGAENKVAYADEATLAQAQQLFALLNPSDTSAYGNLWDARLLECLIIRFLGCCTAKAASTADLGAIQSAVLYINSHFCENPKMRDVAARLHFSEGYFCRLFKQNVGVSYKTYLKKLRLEYSFKLLKNTNLSITEIAAGCGYETQSHFNREFKQYFSAAPSEFRRPK